MRWRLLLDGGASGARNMAVDEALLHGVARDYGERSWTHTLRLYWFEPPALSLGAMQPIADVDLDACHAAGVDVVRRPTGGRAVLHDGCLTYSVSGLPDGSVFSGGIRDAYARIAQALHHAVALLGLDGVTHAAPRAVDASSPSCFDVAAPYELVVNGRKLVGSAQVRRGGSALQHGSLLLAPPAVDVRSLLRPRRLNTSIAADGLPADGLVTAVGARHASPRQDGVDAPPVSGPVTLSEVLGRAVSRAEAADAILAAFGAVVGVELVGLPLTADEVEEASAQERRYESDDWTWRR